MKFCYRDVRPRGHSRQGRLCNRPELTPGDLLRVASATEVAERQLDRGAKGIVGHVVGEAIEALQYRKVEQTDRRSR